MKTAQATGTFLCLLLACILNIAHGHGHKSGTTWLTLIGGVNITHSPTPIASAEPPEGSPPPPPSLTPFPTRSPMPTRQVAHAAYTDTHYRFKYDMHHTRRGWSTTSLLFIFAVGIGGGIYLVRRRQERIENATDLEPLSASNYTSLMPASYE